MATASQTMAVAMPRRRGKSPVGRKRFLFNDVSGARSAGSNEMQQGQKPYLNSFMKALAQAYPQNSNIEEAQTKLASFVIPVTSTSHVDIVEIAQQIKKNFPLVNVLPGEQPGEMLWELPYMHELPSRNWGGIAAWFLLVVAAVGIFVQVFC